MSKKQEAITAGDPARGMFDPQGGTEQGPAMPRVARKRRSGKPPVPTRGRTLTKQLKRLKARQTRSEAGKGLPEGHHKPGSMNRHKSCPVK